MTLHATNISCIRGYSTLFKNVSFHVSPRQLLLVEGPNGSGKTSLLKIITGLRSPNTGTLSWQGNDIHNPSAAHSPSFNQSLAWLGHHNPLKDDQSALENLTMLGVMRPRNQTRLVDALQRVKLGNVKHKLVKTFSAGMKRRLMIASLLISDTPLWVLDEPQAALDKAGIALFESLATEHLQNDGIIVMTSHHDVAIDARFIQPLLLGALNTPNATRDTPA